MSSKSKIIISIILLAVGSGLIPTGFFVNQYIRDEVRDGVPDALLTVREDTLPTLEAQLPVLATPEILRELRDLAIESFPAIINGSVSAQTINGTIYGATVFYGSFPAALDGFFNDPAWSTTTGGFMPINGTSEVITGGFLNLSFSVASQQAIMINGISIPSVADIPGLVNDTQLGLGILGFLEIYMATFDPITGSVINATIQALYNASWAQLSALAGYLSTYMFDIIVPSLIGMSPQQYAPIAFYSQWADGSLVEGGIDLSLLQDGVPPNTKGAEAGVPTPTNISLLICYDLWNESITSTFVDDNGILIWIGALTDTTLQTLLISTFGITPTQLTILLGWLGSFMLTLTPTLLLAETGYTISELALFMFNEQWANGTMNGQSILPDGFLSELVPPIGPPYFEVGLPVSTGLSITQTINLWNETSEYSLVTSSGINKWYAARNGTSLYNSLKSQNDGLSDAQMSAILTWLPPFRDIITNKLGKIDQNLPMEPYNLGSTILMGLGVGGGALAALGAIFLFLSRRK